MGPPCLAPLLKGFPLLALLIAGLARLSSATSFCISLAHVALMTVRSAITTVRRHLLGEIDTPCTGVDISG